MPGHRSENSEVYRKIGLPHFAEKSDCNRKVGTLPEKMPEPNFRKRHMNRLNVSSFCGFLKVEQEKEDKLQGQAFIVLVSFFYIWGKKARIEP